MTDEHTQTDRNDRKRRTVLKSLAAGGLAVGGVGFANSVAAQPTRNVREQRDLTGQLVFNECTNEEMEITRGTQLFVRKDIRSGPDDCRLTVTLQVTWQGVKAVGLDSGRTYQGNFSLHDTDSRNTCEGDPLTSSRIENRRWVSQGPADNFVETVRVIDTVNANGEPTVSIEVEETECR